MYTRYSCAFLHIRGIKEEKKVIFLKPETAPHFSHEIWKVMSVRFPRRLIGKEEQGFLPHEFQTTHHAILLCASIKNLIHTEKIRDLRHQRGRIMQSYRQPIRKRFRDL
jgi:hypothetical protein